MKSCRHSVAWCLACSLARPATVWRWAWLSVTSTSASSANTPEVTEYGQPILDKQGEPVLSKEDEAWTNDLARGIQTSTQAGDRAGSYLTAVRKYNMDRQPLTNVQYPTGNSIFKLFSQNLSQYLFQSVSQLLFITTGVNG